MLQHLQWGYLRINSKGAELHRQHPFTLLQTDFKDTIFKKQRKRVTLPTLHNPTLLIILRSWKANHSILWNANNLIRWHIIYSGGFTACWASFDGTTNHGKLTLAVQITLNFTYTWENTCKTQHCKVICPKHTTLQHTSVKVHTEPKFFYHAKLVIWYWPLTQNKIWSLFMQKFQLYQHFPKC